MMSADPPRLSLAMIAKNEARCLARCLGSVRDLVSEIVVVDTGSTDSTADIARGFQAQVHTFPWVDDFAAARNFALDQARGDWILVLDADEHASPGLCAEIAQFVQGPPAIGRLRIVSEFRRQGQLLSSQCHVARLFPRGPRFEGRIHEQVVSSLPRKNLQAELWHDGYLETHKSERNIKLLSRELERAPDNAYYLFQLAIEHTSLGQAQAAFGCLQKAFSLVRPEEPFAPNLVVDYLYCILEVKQYEIGLQVVEEARPFFDDFPDFHLACGLFYMNLVRSNPAKHIAHLPQIEHCFLRCLALGETQKYKSVLGTGSFLAHYNLGTLYHVFGDEVAARRCFEASAQMGYAPAAERLRAAR